MRLRFRLHEDVGSLVHGLLAFLETWLKLVVLPFNLHSILRLSEILQDLVSKSDTFSVVIVSPWRMSCEQRRPDSRGAPIQYSRRRQWRGVSGSPPRRSLPRIAKARLRSSFANYISFLSGPVNIREDEHKMIQFPNCFLMFIFIFCTPECRYKIHRF